jgi:3'-phosphoadenosine 5'-phosphosulfate sulfotransferase (PAPS reductase)/FAD synthetase
MRSVVARVVFHAPQRSRAYAYPVAAPDEAVTLLQAGAAVAIGVSGGKDSSAVAIRLVEYLDHMGHTGPRVLIHSDLGRVEWRASLPVCEELAQRLGLELMVVRRRAGDMLARWQGRWQNNVARYADLSCVKLILPWSTPAMRFCTSELKTAVIASALSKRFPDRPILSVTGIRRAESASRAKMPVLQVQPKLTKKGRPGYNWNPIIDWATDEVFAFLEERNEQLHEAYRVYQASRVSCCYCVMSSGADLRAAAGCADNHEVYRDMVALEAESTFAFQGSRWLADVAPDVLADNQRERMDAIKAAAKRRAAAEARIPAHLLFKSGRPMAIPTWEEATLLAAVRREVAEAVGIEVRFTDPASVIARYTELATESDINDCVEPNDAPDLFNFECTASLNSV